MRFASLGSGSKGNSALVQAGQTLVMIDCGFQIHEAEARLARLGVKGDDLDAILVTHEHGDHINGVAKLARRHHVPVWMTPGTFAAWKDSVVPRIHNLSPHDAFSIGDLEVQPFPVPHDAREPCHYVFSDGTHRVATVSDAGHVTPHMRETLSGCDALMLEFNHDETMLREGPYHRQLKERVGSDLGHLSNVQAAGLLAAVDCSRLQHLLLTHLSEVNNTPQLARAAACEALDRDEPWMVCAHQTEGFSWRELA
ncbi:MAG: MBL fold metallo-hydrolase [Pseudomonadota bacterium]